MIGTYLGVATHAIEHLIDAARSIVEVIALPDGFRDGLEDLLILLVMGMLHLLGGADIVLEIDAGMLPGVEALVEESGGLRRGGYTVSAESPRS